jgi:transcription antitermination factor NusG
MTNFQRLRPGQRVRILSGGCQFLRGVVDVTDDDRRVANIVLEQPSRYTTTEEDYDNVEVLEKQ